MRKQSGSRWLSRFSEVLYPRRCPLCDRLLREDEPYVCRNCAKDMKLIRGPVCMKCGRPLSSEQAEYCDNCRKMRHRYIRGFAPFAYGGAIQDSLMRFKYSGRAEYASFYAKVTAVQGKDLFRRWKPEMIIPVPIHPARYSRRGYNQAAVFGEKLAAELGIPQEEDAVIRSRNTKPQKGLDPAQRRNNLRGAFRVREDFPFPNCVLVVDDIYTTGTTVDELAGVLQNAGVARVYAACIAIAEGAS